MAPAVIARQAQRAVETFGQRHRLAVDEERPLDHSMIGAFISELIRAANEVPKLTVSERARLLQCAAATIRDYRDEINYSETPANDGGPDDIVYCLNEAAKAIGHFSDAEVAETFLEAIAVIRAAQILLEEKQKIERGE